MTMLRWATTLPSSRSRPGKLDANGKLTINVPTQYVADLKRPTDQDYTVEAAVTDQANREITGRGRFLATRGSFRIHVEPVSYAVRVGDSALFNVTAVDYDNHPVQTRVHLQLVTHKYANGATQTTRGATHRCDHGRQWPRPGNDTSLSRRQHRGGSHRHYPRAAGGIRLQLSVGDGRQ